MRATVTREIAGERCTATVDLDAIAHNVRAVARRAGTGVIAVVKADAYGHGLEPVVRAIAPLTPLVRMFAVANAREACAVRDAAPSAEVLVMSPALPEERVEIVEHRFVPKISGIEEATSYSDLNGGGAPMDVHVCIDTGMGRMGIWMEEAGRVVAEMVRLPGVRVAGFTTHLPVADEDADFTRRQLTAYEQLLARLRKLAPGACVSHALNSAGVGLFPEHAPDLVRCGLALYGVSSDHEFQAMLRPALTLSTRVALLRDMGPGRSISYGSTYVTSRNSRVATLAIGYADGYPRMLSGRGTEVLIGGVRCPLLGRVTMDQIMVDVTGVHGVEVGDEAVLLGSQGSEQIGAAELAEKALTIPWEIFTGCHGRIRRHYVGAGTTDPAS